MKEEIKPVKALALIGVSNEIILPRLFSLYNRGEAEAMAHTGDLKLIEVLISPNENQPPLAEKTPTTPQLHPKTGWIKILDIGSDVLEVYANKSNCEWACENNHHCKGIQEVEIRTAQSDGNREKELEATRAKLEIATRALKHIYETSDELWHSANEALEKIK